ncbi:MAG: DNA gyrase subunit A, partial [Myxococcales bacterium]|nr:DNA gyrase subunit A [Myxococcales bacterium]
QARAILDMRLARLTGLEAEKLAKEYADLSDLIAYLGAILASETRLMEVIVDELNEVKEKHGQPRRTEIIDDEAEIQIEDLIQEEEMVVTISHTGYIKRTALSVYRAQKRGGKGNRGMEAADNDFVSQLFISSTHSYVLFFSERGKVYVKKVYEIPQAARNAKGRAIVNFIGIEPGERVMAITIAENFDDGHFVTTLTKKGQIKKTALSDYQNYREKGIIGVKIAEDDELLAAVLTDGSAEFLIATRTGKSIRFDESQVRTMGRGAGGVKAIELVDDDLVVGFATTGQPGRDSVLAVCERGYGKRTRLEEFRQQNRGGKGIILIDASDRNGPVVGIAIVGPKEEVLLMTDRGQTIRTRCEEIRETGRNAQGVRVMNVDEEERVVALEVVAESDDDDDVVVGDGDGGETTPESAEVDLAGEALADAGDDSTPEADADGDDAGDPESE